MIDPEILKRLEAIDWCAHCGESADFRLMADIQYIHTWADAQRGYEDALWEYTTLEAQNTLTEHLHSKHPNRYRNEWNAIAATAREWFVVNIDPKLRSIMVQQGLTDLFIGDIRWNVLGTIMEYSFLDCKPPVRFFRDLLTVYEAGHLPCGWAGGEWPTGWLLVY
jgi:hypothetical protein